MLFVDTDRNTKNNVSAYATEEDFRRLFADDVNSLYLLSFLLTANLGKAERCFVAGLDDCVSGSRVFHEWAHSWARRIIVQNAIRLMEPHVSPAASALGALHSPGTGDLPRMPLEYAPFANVLALEDFERFVFVLSVLERYPDQECSALLGTSLREVRATRVRALQHLADVEQTGAVPENDSSKEEAVRRWQ